MSPFLPTFSTSARSTTRTSHLARAGHGLEGFLVVGVGGRGLRGRGARTAAPAPTPSRSVGAGAPALVLGDAGRRPAQAGPDLVGHDLDLRALVTIGRLPRALVEAPGDDDPGPLGQALRGVLRHLLPADHVEERR